MPSDEGPDKKDPAATQSVPRRDFLGLAVGASGAAFAVVAGRSLRRFVEPPARRFAGSTRVCTLDELPAGSSKTVLVDDRPVLVIRGPTGAVRAFSALCTHLQCVVGYSPERNRIECPCHQGVFSADGQPVAGPPPRPLEELAVTLDDRTIVVSSVT